MDILLILALVFSATFLALTGLQRLLHRRLDPTYKRMQELAGSGSAAGAGAAASRAVWRRRGWVWRGCSRWWGGASRRKDGLPVK